MPTLLLSILLLAPLSDVVETPGFRGYHLSSFTSVRAGRFGTDGTLDSGAAVVRLVDGSTGEPIVPSEPMYAGGPSLLVKWQAQLGGLTIDARCLGSGIEAEGDERATVNCQLRLENPLDEPVTEQLAIVLSPGGDDALRRPWPSLPFDEGTSFAQDDRFITRDGRVLLTWVGQAPEVTVAPHVGGPDEEAARFVWSVTLEPGRIHYLEFKLAGPPATEAVAEEAWRERFNDKTFYDFEEELNWQAAFRGAFASFRSASKIQTSVLVRGVHFLRSLGDAQYQVVALSDRPYGHPPTDAAAEAQALGHVLEWGMNEIATNFLETLVEEARGRAGPLSPERRVAYLHGVTRAARLYEHNGHAPALGQAIRDLLAGVPGPLPVEPWQDPHLVAGDLADMVEMGGLARPSLPELTWAAIEDPDSVPGRMQALRRAISNGDDEAAWSLYDGLVEGSMDGLGSMETAGELDGRFTFAMLELTRAMILDDHGTELHVLPVLPSGMIHLHRGINTGWLKTRYGTISVNTYFSGKRLVGYKVLQRGKPWPERTVVHLPEGVHGRRLKGKPVGGDATLQEDGAIEVKPDRRVGSGLNFSVVVSDG